MPRELKSLAVSFFNSNQPKQKENHHVKLREQSHCSPELVAALVKPPPNYLLKLAQARGTEKLEKIVEEIHNQGGSAEFKAVIC